MWNISKTKSGGQAEGEAPKVFFHVIRYESAHFPSLYDLARQLLEGQLSSINNKQKIKTNDTQKFPFPALERQFLHFIKLFSRPISGVLSELACNKAV